MKVTLDAGAFLPERAHAADAGLDLRTPRDFAMWGFDKAVIDTGVHVQIPEGYVGLIKSRSSLFRQGIQCEGVIDSGYTGPVMVCLQNLFDEQHRFTRGDRIAQLLIMPCALEGCEAVDHLEETDRGSGGFGSTGR